MILVFEKVLHLSSASQEGQAANVMDNPLIDEDNGHKNDKAGDNGEALLNSDPAHLMEVQRKRRRVRRDMAIQCVLYGASFAIIWIWLTVREIT